jgi:hypothetical protein
MEERIFKNYLYTLADPREPENIRYIGQTVDPKQRLYNHQRRQRGKSHYFRWKNKIIKDGVKPVMKIIGGTNTELLSINVIEVSYIKLYRSLGYDLVNTSIGGKGGCRKYATEEEKIAARKEYKKTDAYKEYQKEYRKEYDKSDKRKEYMREYNKTAAYKEYQKEYDKSDKRKEYMREYRKHH